MYRIKTIIILIVLSQFSVQSIFGQNSIEYISRLTEGAIDSIEPPIPNITPLFPYHIRDVAICKGPNHKYYLTGTTDDNWGVADGIRVWESSDLKEWNILGKEGFVWTFLNDASNVQQLEIKVRKGRKMRGVWAPEIHFIKNNFWITYSISAGYGSGLLKSITGKPEGPYEDVQKEGPLVNGIDATLFQDDDGSVWYIWGPGKMKKLNDNMSGFSNATEPDFPVDATGKEVGYEGVNMYKKNGRYYLMAAEWNTEGPQNGHLIRSTNENRRVADGRYDCMIAESDNLTGPYSKSYIALSHGGHNLIFDDYEENTWATMFGNDEAAAPFREQPALVKMEFNDEGNIQPYIPFPAGAKKTMPIIYVSKNGSNTSGKSWQSAFNSLQKAINSSHAGTQIWVSKGEYSGSTEINDKTGIYIYGGFLGNEKELSDRNSKKNQSILTGNKKVNHVLTISNSQYVRIDGLKITEGKAYGEDDVGCGAGIFLSGGGESVRFVNCEISNNSASLNGAGVYAKYGSGPLFIACKIVNNKALNNGGGIYVKMEKNNGYHTRFYNCEISNNKAQAQGGVAFASTQLKQTGCIRFVNCLINNNFTLLEGGNIVLKGGLSLLLSHCTLVNNRGMSKGAAIATLGRVPAQNRIINCIFSNNYGNTLVRADVFQGEDATSGKAQNWTQVINCLFHKNAVSGLFGKTFNSDCWMTTEEINKESWANYNIEGNPEFIDPEKQNFKISANSVAIKKGTASNMFPVDIDGEFRKMNVNNVNNSADIGFDEFKKINRKPKP